MSQTHVDAGFEGASSIPYRLMSEIDAAPGDSLLGLGLGLGAVRSEPAGRRVLWLEGSRCSVEVVAIGKRCLHGGEARRTFAH